MATIEQALTLALADHRAGRHSEAASLCRRILDIQNDNAVAWYLLGLIELRTGKTAEGLAALSRAVVISPGFVEARLNLGTALHAIGHSPQAAAMLRGALAVQPDLAAAWHGLGRIHFAQGGAGMAQAITCLRRVTALDPSSADAHHDLGLALRHAERLDEAVASQRRAIAARGDFLSAHMNLGNALLERGDHREAAASLQTALDIHPNSPECWYNLGNVRYASGDLAGALSCYRRSATLGLDLARGRVPPILVGLGMLAEAEKELMEILPLTGTDGSNALELLAEILIKGGRLDEARTLFSRLAGLPQGGILYSVECLTALAAIDLKEDQPHAAAARLAKVGGDNCWMFTIKSQAAFRATLAERGLRLSRPDPVAMPSARPRVTSSTLASKGRFAHNVMEYILIRLYAEKYGYVLETPDWVGGTFFELDDPPQGAPLPPLLFCRRTINDLVTDQGDRDPIGDCDILSPLFLFDHKDEYRERVQSWLKPRALWAPYLDPAMAALRQDNGTVVAIHIRRGDFVQYKYPITETAWYVDWLRALWPSLTRPVLYIASDDLTATLKDFAEFKPVTLTDVASKWPGLDYLQDFHVLMHADVVGISAASGFSLLAARLNTKATLFVEPDTAAGCIRPFTPWSRPASG